MSISENPKHKNSEKKSCLYIFDTEQVYNGRQSTILQDGGDIARVVPSSVESQRARVSPPSWDIALCHPLLGRFLVSKNMWVWIFSEFFNRKSFPHTSGAMSFEKYSFLLEFCFQTRKIRRIHNHLWRRDILDSACAKFLYRSGPVQILITLYLFM